MIAVFLEVWKDKEVPAVTYMFLDYWPRVKVRLRHFTRGRTFDGLVKIRVAR